MTIAVISKQLLKEKNLVLVPRKKYEGLLNLQKIFMSRLTEIKDTDSAVRIYQKEKKQKKLKILKSLADLR
ncbi:MAG: hypothetical protein AAB861_01895 [Patescibacteria group bacterium]|mgnify:FL=1